ncbi:MAG: hypothetical protein DRP82_03545 [Planctomycetota bacterium]|nr:MAG: hypothetical protein DRP82_03545 [Planctomycetota bacterium]
MVRETTSPTGSKGFTLLELLVVILIIGMLMGIGVGVTVSLTRSQEFAATAASYRAFVVLAGAGARLTHSPTAIKAVPQQNRAFYLRTVETLFFRFEDLASGRETIYSAYGIPATCHNVFPTAGVVGVGAEFGTNPQLKLADSYISVAPGHIKNPAQGLYLSVWLYPGDFRSGRFLSLRREVTGEGLPRWHNFRQMQENELRFAVVCRRDCFFLYLTESYALEFGFYNGENGYFRTRCNVIRPNVWQLVEVAYDGAKLDMRVDGISLSVFYVDEGQLVPLDCVGKEKLRRALPERVPVLQEPLTISAPAFSFYGAMDEVRVGGIVVEQSFSPPNASLMHHPVIGPETGYKPEWVHFGADGRLDPRYHATEAQLLLTNNPYYKPKKPVVFEAMRKGGVLSKPPDYEEFARKKREERATPQSKVALVRVLPSGAVLLEVYKWDEVMAAEAEQ